MKLSRKEMQPRMFYLVSTFNIYFNNSNNTLFDYSNIYFYRSVDGCLALHNACGKQSISSQSLIATGGNWGKYILITVFNARLLFSKKITMYLKTELKVSKYSVANLFSCNLWVI